MAPTSAKRFSIELLPVLWPRARFVLLTRTAKPEGEFAALSAGISWIG